MAKGITYGIKYPGERPVIKGGLLAFAGKRVLLLQGPVGPFFKRLARDLEQVSAHVSKIDFNGGDWLFSSRGSIAFRGALEDWPDFFERTLIERKIDVVLLFGDCRAMHLVAHEIAARRGLEIGVFEEGYVRPDYVTLERFGVNGHSRIPRDPAFYLNAPVNDVPPTQEVGNTFWFAAGWAVLYYAAGILLRPIFRHYKHHRPINFAEGTLWLRSAWRKHKFARKERGMQTMLSTALAEQYFLVPLQVHNDAQLHVHSEFDSIPSFIDGVISSFAQFAPLGTRLVIKQHPMDRAYHDHTQLIGQLAKAHGIQERVHYIHDQHLPTLLEHARGVIVINSTVGLSALDHGTPLKVCGSAIYDMPGLTYQGELDDFWNDAQDCSANRDLFHRFRCYLIEYTQLNGSFYRPLALPASNAGLVWSPSMEEQRILEPLDAVKEVNQLPRRDSAALQT